MSEIVHSRDPGALFQDVIMELLIELADVRGYPPPPFPNWADRAS